MTAQRVIQQYAGRSPRIDDPLMRAAFERNMIVSSWYYPPGTADWDLNACQVLLNEETADYLYTAHTPLDLHYVPGSRPMLERLVHRIAPPAMTEREKVFAIIRYCHHGMKDDFKSPLPENTIILNATEEEILKFGGGQCEDRSRLIICLCQIAGISARYIAAASHFRPEEGYALHGGHAIVEIFMEGGWAFFDSSCMDFYCLRDDGRIASLWDLRQHPELVENQPDSVYQECGTTKEGFVAYRDNHLSTRAVASISNYFVWDGWRYDWTWVRICYDKSDEEHRQGKKKRAELRIKLLTDIGIPREDIK